MPQNIEVADAQLRLLRLIAKSEGRSLDDVVRNAIDAYLTERHKERQPAFDAAFGLWGEGEDGLAYQERLRHE